MTDREKCYDEYVRLTELYNSGLLSLDDLDSIAEDLKQFIYSQGGYAD